MESPRAGIGSDSFEAVMQQRDVVFGGIIYLRQAVLRGSGTGVAPQPQRTQSSMNDIHLKFYYTLRPPRIGPWWVEVGGVD